MSILAAAQAVVDGCEGTPDGVLVPLHLLDALADAVDRADAEDSRRALTPCGRGGSDSGRTGAPPVAPVLPGHQPAP